MSYRFGGALTLVAASALLAVSGCGGANSDLLLGPQTSRVVLTPSAVAALSANEHSTGLPSEVRLGGAFGHSALFLRFPQHWRAHGVPQRAFLVLSATPHGSIVEPVRVQVWRASTAWLPEALHDWSDKPALAPPYVSVEAASPPPAELRIDVSEWLRFAADHPERDFGVALLAHASSGAGLSVATGVSGGRGPRLEVYLGSKR